MDFVTRCLACRNGRYIAAFVTALTLAITASLVSQPKSASADYLPAGSSAFLQWDDQGDSFRTFGGNQAVTIALGALDRVAIGSQVSPLGCPIGAHNDFLTVAADVYVIQSGTSLHLGDKLTNLATADGSPNTIETPAAEGVFTAETIAITAPGGNLPQGRYEVVYDECQDGVFEPWDAVFDPAFSVGPIDPNIPVLQVQMQTASIAKMKKQAGEVADQWKSEHDQYNLVFKFIDTAEWAGAQLAEENGDVLPLFELITEKLEEKGLLPSSGPSLGQPGLSELGLRALENMESHYNGLKNDPSDPAYNVLSELSPRLSIDPQSNDPLLIAGAALETSVSNQDAVVGALIDSLQRYEGATDAGDGQWALVQARLAKSYTQLLQTRIAATDSSLLAATNALTADTRPFDSVSAALFATAQGVRAVGLSPAQMAALQDLGLSAAQIASVQQGLGQELQFSKSQLENASNAIASGDVGLRASLTDLSATLGTDISTLGADPLFLDQAPIASLPPQFSGSAGVPITFDARASISPSPITSFEWDLEGDGLFDDATGSVASFTFQGEKDGIVGVRVTNAAGYQGVAFGSLNVAGVNARPTITAVSPQPDLLSLVNGQTQQFSVSASDGDGDTVSVRWAVDDKPSGSGTTFTYSTQSTDVGIHLVQAIATDSSPFGGSVVQEWTVGVLAHQFDPTPPVIVPTLSPAPNANGWNAGPVSVSWSVTDPDSGIASSTGCTQMNIVAETAGTVLTCAAVNGGGDQASQLVTVRVDETPPSTSATVSPAPNSSGINDGPVKVTLTSSDGAIGSGTDHIDYALSGATTGSGRISGSSGTVSVSTQGTTTISFGATDLAGNAEAPHSIAVTIHQLAPTTSASLSPPPNVQGISTGNVAVNFSAVPAPSGSPVASITYALNGAQTGGATVSGASASTVINIDGVTTVTYFATDQDGKVERTKSLTVDIQRAITSYTVDSAYALSVYASGFTPNCGGAGPVGMAFDTKGALYVTEFQTGSLYKLPPGGGAVSAVNRLNVTPYPGTSCGSAAGLAFSRSGRLYLALENGATFPSATNEVIEVDPTTGAIIRQVATGGCPVGLQTDPVSGDLFFTTAGCENSVRRISNYEQGTPFSGIYALTSFSPDGITFAPDGTIYVATGVGDIYQLGGTASATPGIGSVLANLSSADGIAVQAGAGTGGANVLYVNRNNGTLTRLDLGTKPITVTDVFTGGSRGDFVAVGPDGCLYATQTTTVLKVTKADGTCSLAPTTVLPQLGLHPVAATTSAGTSQTLTAQLTNVSNPAGVPVTFTITGANQQTGTAPADAHGVAVFTYFGAVPGQDQAVASAAVGTTQLASNQATITWTGTPATSPPSITPLASPAANAAGWNNTDVTVGWEISDPSSPILSSIGCGLTTLVQDTPVSGTTMTCTATNAAGQSSTASVFIKIDKTPPVIAGTASPGPNPRGWNNTNVTVTFSCSDPLSGMASCPGPTVVSTEGVGQSVKGTATDVAGNSASFTVTGINIDKTPPSVRAAASPAANSAGWNNSPVTVAFVCSDALSGVISCPAPVVLSQEGALQSVAGTTVDSAGNSASVQVDHINIDMTKPTIRGVFLASTATVRFTCGDVLSGVAVCPAPVSVAAGTNQVSGTTTDRAGNAGSTTVTTTAQVAKLALSGAPPTPTEGQAFGMTVKAEDPAGNVVASYRGTVHFTVSAGQAPADYTFTAADAGVHAFLPPNGFTLAEEGSQQVAVTDKLNATLTSTAMFVVSDAALSAAGTDAVTPAAFIGVVANFSDADPGGIASDYTATVDWGDGAPPTTGTIGNGLNASFTVSGQHTYTSLGPFTVLVRIDDVGGSKVAATSTLVVFANPTGGMFLIGPGNASIGTTATFWSPKWVTDNGIALNPPLAQLKGFANGVTNPLSCGGTWTVTPGNSPHPPDSVPTFMAVLVTSQISGDGSRLSGDVTHIVIVKVNSGYGPAPGHVGTGTVVGVLC